MEFLVIGLLEIGNWILHGYSFLSPFRKEFQQYCHFGFSEHNLK